MSYTCICLIVLFQVGEGGAGHFVKMVHNGIEYGDMQLICEAYHLMKVGLGMGNDEISAVRTDTLVIILLLQCMIALLGSYTSRFNSDVI